MITSTNPSRDREGAVGFDPTRADQAEDELEALALEGLNSGEAIEVGQGYWEEKHRRLDERLKKTGAR